MDSSRRNFLKIAGITAVAGIGAPSALNMFMNSEVKASSAAHGEQADPHGASGEHGAAPAGKRMGMVIDARVFNDNPGLAEKCIDACHSFFNVPNFGNKKDEIKWIWQEPYTNSFPDHSHYKRDNEVSGSL